MTHTFKLSRRTARLRAASLASVVALVGACAGADSLEPTRVDDVSGPSFAVTSSSIAITNVSAKSGKTYKVGYGLAVGTLQYIDRTYKFASSIPSSLAGLAYIQTANDDKNASLGSSSFLTFNVSVNAIVYVGHDDRLPRPSWLTSGFQDTGLDLISSDGLTKFSVFKRSVTAGTVTLGSNLTAAAADASMYVVLIQPASSPAPAPAPAPAPDVTGAGITFGMFATPASEYADPTWSSALQMLSPGTSGLSALASAQKYGIKLVVNLAGSRTNYKNADGTFNMTKWKSWIDKWRTVNIAPYVTNGTILGHYLVDEPSWPGSWGGKAITPAQLEEMAHYSKSIWPAMATTIRVRPDYLIGASVADIDFAWSQWEGVLHGSSFKLTPEQWRDQQIANAQKAGVKLIFGLNFLDGGDGSSGIPGTYNLSLTKDRWQMSAAEITRVGKVLAAASYACGVMNWRWSTNYPTTSYMTTTQINGILNFNKRSDVKTALAGVAAVAKNRTTTSCKK